jgi:hypothetical protein
MLALTDDQMRRVQEAAKPLPYRLREPYLRALSKLLEGQHPISNGTLQRACGQAQQHVMALHAMIPDDDLSFLG